MFKHAESERLKKIVMLPNITARLVSQCELRVPFFFLPEMPTKKITYSFIGFGSLMPKRESGERARRGAETTRRPPREGRGGGTGADDATMARRDRADYAGMSDSQVAVACAVEQARIEARDKARSEFGCIRSQLGEESTWWLCQPPKMRSMAADVAHRGDPMPFEVEGELLESLEILPEERMSKVYRILGQSQGWSLGQGKASVDVEKKIDVTVDVKGVDLGALQPPTLWRLHRYINACFRAEACKELKRSLGFGCVFCG